MFGLLVFGLTLLCLSLALSHVYSDSTARG